jgi:hypothetical protein
MTGSFWVADLNARGELQAKAEHRYQQLERLPDAAELIIQFSTLLWRYPEEFETSLSPPFAHLWIRWRAAAPTAGIATLRCRSELASLSLLASGKDPNADRITFEAFQRHLLRELHDTGFEPAFTLLDLTERPLVATINFAPPSDQSDQFLVALADRCFAASYFRSQDLA